MLKKNTCFYSNIIPINKGVWNNSCSIYIVDIGEGNASFRVTTDPNLPNIIETVDVISINDLILDKKINNISLLKMDIEGSEYQCFQANTDWVKKVECLAIEIHDGIYPGTSDLINKTLNSDFEKSKNGEYHIYKRKVK